MRKSLEHWKVVTFYLIIYDYIAILASYFFALLLRFDLRFSLIQKQYINGYLGSIFYYALFVVIVFQIFKLYRSIWRFASYSELLRMIVSTVITGITYYVVMFFNYRMPVSYYIFGIFVQMG